MPRIAARCALIAVAVLLGGCGSTVTKSDFVARADAICASTTRQLRTIPPPDVSAVAPARQTTAALAGYLDEVLPIAQSEAAKVRALKRPDGKPRDRAALDAYVGALAQAVVDYRALAIAARQGDAPGVASAEAALRTNRVASLAASYGLQACGSAGATGVGGRRPGS